MFLGPLAVGHVVMEQKSDRALRRTVVFWKNETAEDTKFKVIVVILDYFTVSAG